MSVSSFNNLPDYGRVWVFIAGSQLSIGEQQQVEETFTPFLERWAAHGDDLSAAYTILEDRFLVVGVDTDKTLPSGCSIDALTRAVRQLEEAVNIDLLDTPDCCYLDEAGVRCVSREEFRELASQERVDASTEVFDRTVMSVADIRSGRFRTSAGNTWLAKAFPLSQTAE